MNALPLRLPPGSDLRRSLEEVLAAQAVEAAFVVSGLGSLSHACLRLATAESVHEIPGDLEILTLSGSLARNGSHLHMSVADADGRVMGGHVVYGCVVRTTAEVLIMILPDWSFTRELDPATGCAELVIRDSR
jgi:predicted DNA-binding protein with PD1-like motif